MIATGLVAFILGVIVGVAWMCHTDKDLIAAKVIDRINAEKKINEFRKEQEGKG